MTQLDLLRPRTKSAYVVAVPMDVSLNLDLKDLAKKLGGVPLAEIMRVAARAVIAAGERVPVGGTIFDLEREILG